MDSLLLKSNGNLKGAHYEKAVCNTSDSVSSMYLQPGGRGTEYQGDDEIF